MKKFALSALTAVALASAAFGAAAVFTASDAEARPWWVQGCDFTVRMCHGF